MEAAPNRQPSFPSPEEPLALSEATHRASAADSRSSRAFVASGLRRHIRLRFWRILVYLTVLLYIVANAFMVAGLMRANGGLQDPSSAESPAMMDDAMKLARIAGDTFLITQFLLAIAFVGWLAVAYRNVGKLRGKNRFGFSMVFFSWLPPLLFFVPYMLVWEIIQRLHRSAVRGGRIFGLPKKGALNAWWALFLVSNITWLLVMGIFGALGEGTPTDELGYYRTIIWLVPVAVAGAITVAMLVRQVTALERMAVEAGSPQ